MRICLLITIHNLLFAIHESTYTKKAAKVLTAFQDLTLPVTAEHPFFR
jgi:hypothetical protein